jgi:hypothetical protein
MRAARTAGIRLAAAAMAVSRNTEDAKISGSLGDVPNRKLVMNLDALARR